MPTPKKNPLTKLIKKGAKKAVVKVKPKPNLKAEPKSNVKVKPAAKTKANPYNDSKHEYYATESYVRALENNRSDWSVGKAKQRRAYKGVIDIGTINKKKKKK